MKLTNRMKYTERNIHVKKRVREFNSIKIVLFFICSALVTCSVSSEADLAEIQARYASKNNKGINISKEKIAGLYSIFQGMGNPFAAVIKDIKDPANTLVAVRDCDPYYQKPYNYICGQSHGGKIKLSILGGRVEHYEITVDLERALGEMGAFRDFGASTELRELSLELFQVHLRSYASRSLKISFSGWNLYIEEEL